MKRLHACLLISLLLPACATHTPASTTASNAEYEAAMAKEHAHDTTGPSGAENMSPPDRGRVYANAVTYAIVDGKPVTGYYAVQERAPKRVPGIIVIHEWWGLNDNIKAMTKKLAAQGYQVLAVDLYNGQVATEPKQAEELMKRAMSSPDAVLDNLKQARTYLNVKYAPKIGVIGWCFGGGWSLETALSQPDAISAAVVYYGRPKTTAQEVAPLKAPLLAFYGAADQGIKVANVKKFQAALKKAGKDAEIHIYPGVGHAFANPTGSNYAPKPAQDAWKRTLAFFAAHLR